MDPSSRIQGGTRYDDPNTGGQRDDPMSKSGQGRWEQGGDNMGGQGGDSYGQQRSDQGGYEYGQTGTAGFGGTQSDQTKTSGQYGGQERFPTSQSQTAGYADPTRVGGGGSQPEDDDDYGASVGPGGGPTGASRQSGTGKPSMTSRVKGAAEQMAGKITGDPSKQARGREREEGNF